MTRVFPNNMAEVAVTRTTACGGNCGNCESCIFQSELKAMAKNRVSARPGQKVLIESKSSKVFGAALLVYILPLVFFLAGFAIAYSLGAAEGVCVAVSFLGLAVGVAVVVASQRLKKNKNPISFDIVELI
ncbi:MAG: SoxR reducing system RseC family protein [Candidatus Limivicinus sp.]|nr:SoxR reducing system RseC family protein [Candidatus Limivicinus sp.]